MEEERRAAEELRSGLEKDREELRMKLQDTTSEVSLVEQWLALLPHK